MKLYVDGELPKNCYDCPCMDYHEGVCQVTNQSLCFNYDENHCPLQSLTDYAKQVRKEVCEEIRKQLVYYPVSLLDEAGKVKDNIWGISMKDLTEILDKIQGDKVE